MNKIPTLFIRDGRFKVTPDVTPGCEWVLGPSVGVFVTEKLDGTNIRVTWQNGAIVHVEKRRNPTREEKAAGAEPGYVDAHEDDPADKHIWAAVQHIEAHPTGGRSSCEAIGPKIQGNPLGLTEHRAVPLALMYLPFVPDVPRTFDGLRDFLREMDSVYSPGHHAEGLVFYHADIVGDGRMAKLKGKDFG